jgi:uncharacterized protein YndB with AHSA1/START domain
MQQRRHDVAGISGSFEFTAPAEVVFGVLTDPDRTSRWLPSGMTAESADPARVRVRSGDQVYEYEVKLVPDDLSLSWTARDDSGLAGTARVEDAPAGGSVVHAEVSGRDPDDEQIRDLLAETMQPRRQRQLQRGVTR